MRYNAVVGMRWRVVGMALTVVATAGCSDDDLAPVEPRLPDGGLPPVTLPTRITFGSCSDAGLPMPLLDVATQQQPDLHLWLGDNVYADTRDEEVMRDAYRQLAVAPEVGRLVQQAHSIATWDDHDYGENDAGASYPMKEAARQIFLTFWGEPQGSARWERDGVYTSYRYEQDGHQLQIILLDTRYNRDSLLPNDGTGKNDYVPHVDETSMILGEAQWAWLEERLREPADVRLVASSVQFGHAYNGYESWTLFPRERQRFVDLIQATGAEGVVFLSGDVHWAEISRLEVPGGYDLFDVTSSGVNQDWPFVESNESRVGEAWPEHNVGLVEIEWETSAITASILDAEGVRRLELTLGLEDLRF